MLNERPSRVARCMAASAIPTTGPEASSRQASRPGSPKHASTNPSTPSASAAATDFNTPGRARASSTWLSIEAGPVRLVIATSSVPGSTNGAAQRDIRSVIRWVVFGLSTAIRRRTPTAPPVIAGPSEPGAVDGELALVVQIADLGAAPLQQPEGEEAQPAADEPAEVARVRQQRVRRRPQTPPADEDEGDGGQAAQQ